MTGDESDEILLRRVEDLEHQQLRVLILIAAVSEVSGNAKKLDGLTKLAKLDFIARYQDFEPLIALALDISGVRTAEARTVAVVPTSTPMIRYRYGPWDDQYYPVLGALVGRGLIKYVRGKGGSVGFSPTVHGSDLVAQLRWDVLWAPVVDHYESIANRYGRHTGSALKNAIYDSLPKQMDVAFRTELR
ncbi:hypothetical protein [Mycobacteroides abscessus]|uniref:hypothetical protein n=1 Tax=Mycobacteroides abscessus TaxID=36809 RepID=UPI0005DBD9BA|nr:hypothetical protein [Mycobacteroides abscessus]CPS05940.1 Uncharacterised protein [Mycobacteroides abscessus]CPS17248.1 Uncharacterised protein [Mycobacteroides abscessus]CPS22497.1 Uncharacterised protein [Mycobacteroides abscessus]CPS90390.1 Uncharacterised protein [Mycobacteroides abscessus]CPT45322.1 Uncharacterised protein [Mycobacteroides abscessus]